MDIFGFKISFNFKKKRKSLSDVDLWKNYVKHIISADTKLHSSNIIIHNDGEFGLSGRSSSRKVKYTFSKSGTVVEFKIKKSNSPFIYVPEIKNWWGLRVWLHEIGHIANNHHKGSYKLVHVEEYEAELYCLDKAKDCPKVDMIVYLEMEYSAIKNVYTSLMNDVFRGEIIHFNEISDDIINFLGKYELYSIEDLKQGFKTNRVLFLEDIIKNGRKL